MFHFVKKFAGILDFCDSPNLSTIRDMQDLSEKPTVLLTKKWCEPTVQHQAALLYALQHYNALGEFQTLWVQLCPWWKNESGLEAPRQDLYLFYTESVLLPHGPFNMVARFLIELGYPAKVDSQPGQDVSATRDESHPTDICDASGSYRGAHEATSSFSLSKGESGSPVHTTDIVEALEAIPRDVEFDTECEALKEHEDIKVIFLDLETKNPI